MKKLNQSKSIVVYLLLLFITSCSTDNNELSQNATDKESRIIKNIEALSSFIIESNVDIQEKLAKNGKLAFDEKFTIALNSSKNETDIKKAFETAGIKDSDAIMSMLKEQINVKKQFVKDNPDFYKLNIDKRNTLFNKSFDAAVTNLSNPFRTQTLKVNSFGTADKYAYASNCSSAYRTVIGRCNRDYVGCGTLAVITGGFTGGLGGLLAAAACMYTFNNCYSYAGEDYNSCIFNK